MPFVAGNSLRARLVQEKQLPVDEAIHVAVAVASALDYAHRHGVIHRDLKPENILLHEGQPLVADFGIALAVTNAGGNRITQTGISLGTPEYMSPEQATGDRQIDARTDIYSLGAVMYEGLAGRPVVERADIVGMVSAVLHSVPDRPSTVAAGVPRDAETICMKCLEKDPARRYASAAELAKDLNRWLGGEAVSAHAPSLAYKLSKALEIGRASCRERV